MTVGGMIGGGVRRSESNLGLMSGREVWKTTHHESGRSDRLN